MPTLVCDPKIEHLPRRTESIIPVLMYGLPEGTNTGLATIGNPIIKSIKELGVQPSVKSIDFLTIALSVIAGDTFVSRKDTVDGWTREISIALSLNDPTPWNQIKPLIEKAIHFLSGDIWHFDFYDGGFTPSVSAKGDQFEKLIGFDCACLFSGGLDSAIGAIDLRADHKKPLLVSHSYPGDAKHQNEVSTALVWNMYRFSANADPHLHDGINEITMRTRSIGFLAFGIIAASVIEKVNHIMNPILYVPENGFISLNVPLTPRRVGSLSTRTTHPYFIASIQEILDHVGLHCRIVNPYQFLTKGEMVKQCKDTDLLRRVIDKTVSCSHWKRRHQQCGVCVPCIIRRAAVLEGNIPEGLDYVFRNLSTVLQYPQKRDDLIALTCAIEKMKQGKERKQFANSGPLPIEEYDKYRGIYHRGLIEVSRFFNEQGIKC